jgi:hypothetical protein
MVSASPKEGVIARVLSGSGHMEMVATALEWKE